MSNFKFLFSLFLIIVSVHLIGTLRSWYWDISWLDLPMHFAGGFFLAILFLWLRKQLPDLIKTNFIIFDFIIVIGFVALIGVLWEFFEYSLDYIFANRGVIPISQVNVGDTMMDLFLDLLGGSIAYILDLLFSAFISRTARNR